MSARAEQTGRTRTNSGIARCGRLETGATKCQPARPATVRSATRILSLVLAAVLAATSMGCETTGPICLTQRLWETSDLQGHFRPAPDPRLEVFLHASGREALARYDELREKDARVRSRGLMLRADTQERPASVRPHFVSPTPPRGATKLPVLAAGATGVAEPHARWSTVTNEFFVNAPGWDSSARHLPEYEDHKNPAGKILLTPFAVVGDAVIYAVLIASLLGFTWWGSGGGSIEVR